uniref:Choline transporter-like protein n=1 Tax=Corethron hystrix TaxID=216773 RepID=A0A7S1BNA3_9STRA|mmetsp:Transcript_33651/g.77655  ORF Transcript_33651/g.77655 Transcript_33651/m.77655 type:complete len:310 (+) Transcript_33651:232-1161(+)
MWAKTGTEVNAEVVQNMDHFGTSNNQEYVKGEMQPKQYRDKTFTFLFLGHLVAMIWVWSKYIPEVLNTNSSGNNDVDSTVDDVSTSNSTSFEFSEDNINGIKLMVVAPAIVGFAVSLGGLALLISCAKTLIHISLLLSILVSVGIVLIALMSGQVLYCIISIILALFTCCYYCAVKDRIPFAAANLNTAASAVKANFMGLFLSTIFFDILSFVYVVTWSFSFYGIQKTWGCFDSDLQGSCVESGRYAVVFFMLLAVCWAGQVFMNLNQVTTAGAGASMGFELHCVIFRTTHYYYFLRVFLLSFSRFMVV